MGIPLGGGNFTRGAAIPLDDSFTAADTTARDAIASGIRYDGMLVYTVADKKLWQLQGGITNSDWKSAGGGGGISAVTNVSSNVTLTVTDLDTYIRIDATASDKAITLPAASAGNIGKCITFKRISDETYNITIYAAGSDTIDNEATIEIPFTNGTLKIICATATAWELI